MNRDRAFGGRAAFATEGRLVDLSDFACEAPKRGRGRGTPHTLWAAASPSDRTKQRNNL